MTEAELGWCAGIIDGEGTITLKNNGGSNITPAIMVTMTHEATIRRFQQIVKIGRVYKNDFKQSPNHKFKYTWNQCGGPSVLVIRLIQPYLFTKKAQADLAIEFADKCMLGRGRVTVSEEQQILRRVLVIEMRELNKRGV